MASDMSCYYRHFSKTSAFKMTRISLLTLPLTIAALFVLSGAALADSDDPPLFVGKTGVDAGDCQSAAAPCRSINYALKRVGKNGQIRVGDGAFEVTDISDIIYMMSGAISVKGSYEAGTESTLVGIPPEFAAELGAQDFHVIADTKGMHQAAVQTQLAMQANAARTDCVGGMAGVYPCDNVDLLSHVADRTDTAFGSDIWGFVDLNTNREYAIVGYTIGTAVFDVSDVENPREVGFIQGQDTVWRDIKVYQYWNAANGRWDAYAYITTDGASDSLVVLDLTQLPHSIARVSYSGDFGEAHNVYLSGVDFTTGLSVTNDTPNLIIAGSNVVYDAGASRRDGRFRTYSLDNPAAPAFIAAPNIPADQAANDRLYMHDAASVVIRDDRRNTQCVNAGGSDHCDVLIDFNENAFVIWDISDPTAPARLSQTPYPNSGYTHSGWVTEDLQYVFVQDETDERDGRVSLTTLRVFSIANLAAPVAAGNWTGPTNAIDHNGFVRGNRYYMSNYTRGLSILDISNAASPSLVGRFDTYPASDGGGFPGNWGAYPYFPSGNVGVSDRQTGFYMVADRTLDVPPGSLSFTSDSFAADESGSLSLTVERNGGSSGAASVNWEVISGTASDADITTSSGVINWGDGDSAAKTINIGLVNDGANEGIERLLVKLIAPTGGATLSAPNIVSAYVSDPGTTSAVEFSSTDISVTERGFGLAVATLRRIGNANGALSVNYSLVGGDANSGTDFTGVVSDTLTWAAGDANPKNIEFSIADDGAGEANEFFELGLTAANAQNVGANSSVRINILDGLGTNRAPNSVPGNNQTVSAGATVTLDGSGSNDPDGDGLSYAWSQTMGATVTLSNANSSTATFPAPSNSSDSLLRFQLEVSDPSGLSDAATASITVSAAATSSGGGGGGGGGGTFGWLAALLLGTIVFARKLTSRTLATRQLITRTDVS